MLPWPWLCTWRAYFFTMACMNNNDYGSVQYSNYDIIGCWIYPNYTGHAVNFLFSFYQVLSNFFEKQRETLTVVTIQSSGPKN